MPIIICNHSYCPFQKNDCHYSIFMKKIVSITRSVLFIGLMFLPNFLPAYNLRQYSSNNGLSNSSILSICQDKDGFMWFGSCEGLNLFDGQDFQLYNSDREESNLSGNIIERILEAEDNILWIQTNYGLDRLDRYRRTVKSFKQFKGKNWIVKSTGNDIFVVNSDNLIYYYSPRKEKFESLYVENLVCSDILQVAIDKENTLWIFMKNGKYLSYSISFDSNRQACLIPRMFFTNKETVQWCFYDKDTFYFVDDTYALYEYDPVSKNKYYIYDISAQVRQYGEISSIAEYKGDYFIGFKYSGLIVLQHTTELKKRFSVCDINIKSGIFCIQEDRFQDVLWISTDGQGVYMYYNDPYTLRTTSFRDLPYGLHNPVRTIYLDKNNALWFGTKGDGIIKIDNYDIATGRGDKSTQFLSNNSLLENNSVYTIVPGGKNVLWIGGENGLNYYSYKNNQIKNIDIYPEGEDIKYVYSICEFNDTTLWIATVGEGIIKARLEWKNNEPAIRKDTTFLFDKGILPSNYFFTTYKENDSIVWFGNRGYGVYKINNNTNEVNVFSLDKNGKNQTMNDIFSILKNEKGLWFGTSYGLARMYNNEKEQIFERVNESPKSTIHGILQDHYNNLWMSTNKGLIKFNMTENSYRTYRKQNELEITEFSDGAYFKHDPTGVMFFGGINGFVTVTVNGFVTDNYIPGIQFNHLSIFGKEYNIFDFMDTGKEEKTITLNYRQNFFAISFTALDYINGNDYTYYYKISEMSDNWIDNRSSNTASFTNISPGKYTLLVKYRNNITGKESSVQSVYMNILPPWYRTPTAYLIYSMLLLFACCFVAKLCLKWCRMKEENIIEKMKQKQREDIYESKLSFFTNITHEFCTPLSLIYGPCEKILSDSQSGSRTSKYAKLILNNAERLNSLISELIEFRRLETGNKQAKIVQLSVSQLAGNIAESFSELANNKGVDFETNIDGDIIWNSDSGCLDKIISNLISNAFKYTFGQGKIIVDISVRETDLYIAVSNTGKGIKEEDIPKIFDQYTILDNFENCRESGGISRNGLGLAICNNMVKLLRGNMTVTSEINGITVFTVRLPQLELNDVLNSATIPLIENSPVSENRLKQVPEIISAGYDKDKQTIMIVDDDLSMLWFVSEIFVEKYNIVPISDPKEVMPSLQQHIPDLIISDIMMPYIDGISLVATIKADKLLNHIPLILLSAKNTVEEQIRGIESGAEIYITKPFNVNYLEKVVERLIKREADLKQYFSSALSSFEINGGKLVHEEDIKFMEKIYQVIESNMLNPEFSVETIGSSLGYSTRQFYRKLKEITAQKPNDIIRDYKLDVVRKLLITTNLSVDEIIDRTGFVNRGNFFKIFSRKFGMTPKKYREETRKEVTDLESVNNL